LQNTEYAGFILLQLRASEHPAGRQHCVFLRNSSLARSLPEQRDMITLLLALTLILTVQQPASPNIETRYDRFSDSTSLVLTRNVPLLGGVVDLGGGSYYVRPGSSAYDVVFFHVIATSLGPSITRNAKVALAFTSRSSDWVFLRQTNTLRMILDGSERLDFGKMTRTNSDVLSGTVAEQIAVFVSLDAIEKLSQAKRIEVQIGSAEFEFAPGVITDLKEFVNRFPSKK
jgi:hypothetical protein